MFRVRSIGEPEEEPPSIRIEIIDRDGVRHGPFGAVNEHMRFTLANSDALDAIALGRGCFVQEEDKPETRRDVISSNIVSTGYAFLDQFLGECLEIFAPGAIIYRPVEYTSWAGVKLRPGTTILGGSLTNFYDSYGVILEAIPVRLHGEKQTDWAYRSVGPLVGMRSAQISASWHTWDDIGPSKPYGPEKVLEFPSPADGAVDKLLAASEKEILQHFAKHPEQLEAIKPAAFEDLVEAVYKGLGFATERIGAWNQADGGVDIIAVAKTPASTEVRLAIQCKSGRGAVGPRVVRELAAVLDPSRAHQGVVATSSRFTGGAINETEGSFWRVRLQDGNDIYRRILGVLRPELRD